MQITTIDVDLAKHVFQLHGIGPDGRVVLRQKLRRAQMITFFAKLPPCLVGMEACATAHYWARELRALGHQVRLTHQGDAYIRRLLIIGAQSALQRSKEVRENAWVQRLLGRCARLKVAVALANKTARIAWALMRTGDTYRRAAVSAA